MKETILPSPKHGFDKNLGNQVLHWAYKNQVFPKLGFHKSNFKS